MPLARLIFPETPRRLPGHRAIKVVLRALHTLCAGVLVGAYLLDGSAADRSWWLWAAVLTGCAMLLLDLVESGAFLLQVRGAVLLLKVMLVLGLGYYGESAGQVLAGLFVLAVSSSHAPSKLRYFVLVGGDRITGATSKG